MMSKFSKFQISIFIIWLFTLSAVIGMQLGYTDWFLSLSPLNLSIYLALIIWNVDEKITLVKALFVPFGIGMLVEFLGVNYGLIFGNYQYGENLGVKIKGVPLMIGVNWVILTFTSASLARYFFKNKVATSLVAAIMMVLLDLIIEIAAPAMDYWEFQKGIVPVQNYIGWSGTAFIVHLLFQKVNISYHPQLSLHLMLAIILFFTFFILVIHP